MKFIIGNDSSLHDFRERKASGRVSHAYIIEGAEGSGRLTLARAIACTLVCESENAPCYSCPACRKIMMGGHQDVRELIHREKASIIKLDPIRELIKEAYIKPAECDKKIFIIENAQQMAPPSQNALLQIFEEPPRNVIFFLLTTNRNLLLATLKSRAVTIKTQKLTPEVIREELERRFPQYSSLFDDAVLLSDGALGRAFDFLEDESAREAVGRVKEYFHALTEYSTFSALSSILSPATASDRAKLFTLMTYFIPALRDIIARASGYEGKNMFFSDEEELRLLADRLSVGKLISAFNKVSEVIKDSGKINLISAISEINITLCDDFER